MKIILQHIIIIGGLLFSLVAMATGFASHDAAATPGRIAITCMGVNGSGQPADTRQEQRCDAGVKGIYQPTLRGRHS